MTEAGALPVLRPRSLGEIFDAGLVVVIRSLRRTIVLCALVALTIGAIAGVVFCGSILSAGLAVSAIRNATLVVAIVAGDACGIVLFAAFLIVCESEARRIPCTLIAALRQARRRFWPIAGIQVLLVLLAVTLIAAFAALTFGLIAFGRAIAPTSPISGTIIAYGTGIVAIPAGIVTYALYLTFGTVSLSICAAEGAAVAPALRGAWRRCFSRSQIVRATAVGIAWVGPLFAIAFGLAFFRYDVPSGPAIEPILRTVLQLPVFVIGYTWTTVFSLDARIRSEGYDLEVATSEMSVPEIITN